MSETASNWISNKFRTGKWEGEAFPFFLAYNDTSYCVVIYTYGDKS